MKTFIALVVLAALALGTESKLVLNYKRISTREISITCANGGDPTGTKIDDTLIISCGN